MKSKRFKKLPEKTNILPAETFDTLLNEGDEVAFFPPVTGG